MRLCNSVVVVGCPVVIIVGCPVVVVLGCPVVVVLGCPVLGWLLLLYPLHPVLCQAGPGKILLPLGLQFYIFSALSKTSAKFLVNRPPRPAIQGYQ